MSGNTQLLAFVHFSRANRCTDLYEALFLSYLHLLGGFRLVETVINLLEKEWWPFKHVVLLFWSWFVFFSNGNDCIDFDETFVLCSIYM